MCDFSNKFKKIGKLYSSELYNMCKHNVASVEYVHRTPSTHTHLPTSLTLLTKLRSLYFATLSMLAFELEIRSVTLKKGVARWQRKKHTSCVDGPHRTIQNDIACMYFYFYLRIYFTTTRDIIYPFFYRKVERSKSKYIHFFFG